jgi:hypothetical protein
MATFFPKSCEYSARFPILEKTNRNLATNRLKKRAEDDVPILALPCGRVRPKALLSCGYWSKPYDDGLWAGQQVPVPSSEPRVPRTDQTALIVFINQIPLVKY